VEDNPIRRRLSRLAAIEEEDEEEEKRHRDDSIKKTPMKLSPRRNSTVTFPDVSKDKVSI
jgi:hypothetical protein